MPLVTEPDQVTVTEIDDNGVLVYQLQVAPEGRFPQERFTVLSNDPCPVTWNDTGTETLDGASVMLDGEGAVKLKSTIFKVKVASFVTRFGSVPAP